MRVLPPPTASCGNGSGCSNNHRKVTAVTMTTTLMADANADANTPRQLQQQKQLLKQQQHNGKRWIGLPSKDIRVAGVGCIGGKQRPGNGSNNDCGGIVPTAGECCGDPGGAALPPLLPPFPLAR